MSDLDSVFVRRPFEIIYPGGIDLQAARLPAPWHLAGALLTARGFVAGPVSDDAPAAAAQALEWTLAPDRAADPGCASCDRRRV